MIEIPEDVRRLVEERERARTARDFALADEMRGRIRSAGFAVTDTPDGPVVAAIDRQVGHREMSPQEVEAGLDRPPTADASVHWVVEGWPEDIVRGIESFGSHHPSLAVHQVVVDLTASDAAWPDGVEVLRLRRGIGWGAARNAGLLRAAAQVVIVVDGSVEATGDVLGPLTEALSDPDVGLTGPFGIVSDDLHGFVRSDGPRVDAVEAYLMAFRRDLLLDGVRFDEKFKFYRSADIELSFQVKARGLAVTVTDVPVRRHEHRMWAGTPEDERARLSKRNFYRFLDRWRGRTDLLESSRR